MRTVFQVSIILVVLVAAIAFCVVFYFLEEHDKKKHDTDLLVSVSQGVLKGIELTTILHKTKYYAFLGIPYAKPPIGDLRFKEPEAAEPWEGILNATKEGNICKQINLMTTEYITISGSEDCLYLNVYTPQFLNITAERYPVMVWIHGGAFTFGSGNRDMFGPDLLIENDVVIVTFNYRLGSLGFLTVLNDDAPGNAGLKDQVLAMEWVKNNIHNFGGNPYNITLFGESAGSASVHYHTLSPLSKGLFHRAIMESGTALDPWAYVEIPEERAFDFGAFLGYKGRDKKQLIEYLRQIPADRLIATEKADFSKHHAPCYNPNSWTPEHTFGPTAEKIGTGKTFLPDHPRNILKRNEFTKVPIIMGLNSMEGIFYLLGAFINTRDYGHSYGQFIPSELCLKNGTQKYNKLANEINEFFFQGASIDTNHLPQFSNVCSDMYFTIAAFETIKSLRSFSENDLYIYEFTFDGEFSIVKKLLQIVRKDLQIPLGVAHADEMGYLFHQQNMEKVYDSRSPEVKLVNHMTKLWTNFAKYSSPNGQDVDVNWKSSNKNQIYYLDINEKLTLLDTIFFPKKFQFWKNVFKKYGSSYLN